MELTRSAVRLGGLWLVLGCGPGEIPRDGSSEPRGAVVPLEANSGLRARATIAGAPSSGIKGEVRLTELAGNFPVPGVRIEASITGPPGTLTAGRHGFHIHENAKAGCVAPFTSADGHFDPGPSGDSDPDVNHPFHAGDIPNLVVDSNGAGSLDAVTSRVTLSPGPLSLLDEDGSVFIVHEKPDEGTPGPAKSGVSGGPRVACGVVQRDSGSSP